MEAGSDLSNDPWVSSVRLAPSKAVTGTDCRGAANSTWREQVISSKPRLRTKRKIVIGRVLDVEPAKGLEPSTC